MEYEKLLKKARKEMPESVFQKERFEIPKIKGHIQGNRTIIVNFQQIAEVLGRKQEHLLKYILKELAVPGDIKKRAVIFGAKGFSRGRDHVIGGGHPFRETVFKTVKNLCLTLEGVEAVLLPVEIDIDTDGTVAYCAFRYPNGDRMLAIWTDGIAQDEDPGVLATITFPGLTAEKIVAIDVLHGFEQELVFEIDGDSTIIRDLLVKDFPILIHLSDVTLGPDYEETIGDGFHRIGEPDASTASDRDGDGVPDDEDLCPDWPGSSETSGC